MIFFDFYLHNLVAEFELTNDLSQLSEYATHGRNDIALNKSVKNHQVNMIKLVVTDRFYI